MPRLIAQILTALTLAAALPGAATACSPRLGTFAERPAADGAYHYVIGRLVGMRQTKSASRDGWVQETYKGRLVGYRIGAHGPEPVNVSFRVTGKDEFSRKRFFLQRDLKPRMFEVRATWTGYQPNYAPCGHMNLVTSDRELVEIAHSCVTGGSCDWKRTPDW